MKTFVCAVLTLCVGGCASMFGLEESTPSAAKNDASPQKSGNASISVIYHAPAWGPNTNGEEAVYFLKQVTLSSRDDEQSRIYLCSIKPDGSERREIARLWKDNPGQYLGDYAKHITMDVNAATRRAAIGLEEGGGIFVVNLDGSGLHPMWPKEWKEDRPYMAGYPTWSPDGKWLAFQEFRDEKGFHYRIVKCRPDGTEYTPLTAREEYNYEPAWSPNGELIAYVGDRVADRGRDIHEVHLWLMKPDGTDRRDTKVWGYCPRWSPDGKFISHSSTVFDVATRKPVTGKPTKVWNRGRLIYPKWGKSGLVSVGSLDISFASTEKDFSCQLLKNVSRRANMSDIEKENFRW